MNKSSRESSGFANSPSRQSKSRKAQHSAIDHTIKEREAVALIDQGRLDEAEAIYKELIALKTHSFSVYANLAVICGMQSRFDDVIKLLHKALELNSNQPEVHNNLGVAYQEQGDLTAAVASYRKALKLKPNYPDAQNNLGNSLKGQGDLTAAIACYRRAIKLKTNYPEAHYNLGNLLQEQGDITAAISSYSTALQLKRNYPEAHNNLGNALREQYNLDDAIASYNTALQFKPNYPEAHNNLGAALREQGDLDAAIASFNTALQFKPNYPVAHYNLGRAFQKKGDLEAAMATYKKILEIDPENSNAFCGIGRVQQSKGNLQEAKLSFKIAISRDPNNTSALLELSKSIKSNQDTVELLENLGKVNKTGLNKGDLRSLEFAIANCYHKTRNYVLATKHYREANQLKLSFMPSNIADRLNRSKQLFRFSETIIENDANAGSGKIFIVGVPRCGSTLLESILSMNKKIKDLGETRALTQAFTRLISKHKVANKERLDLALAYEEEIKAQLNEFTHSVDKNLYNFSLAGAIARAMPAAKVIHCRRHPLDNILSMMRSNLEVGNNYTADPIDAAKFLIHQEKMLAEIKRRYEGQIYTFNYDDFVNEPEETIKPLIKWLELEWTDNYLHPERNKREINTASVTQARHPISNKSVGGWKNYKELLRPAENILRGSDLFYI